MYRLHLINNKKQTAVAASEGCLEADIYVHKINNMDVTEDTCRCHGSHYRTEQSIWRFRFLPNSYRLFTQNKNYKLYQTGNKCIYFMAYWSRAENLYQSSKHVKMFCLKDSHLGTLLFIGYFPFTKSRYLSVNEAQGWGVPAWKCSFFKIPWMKPCQLPVNSGRRDVATSKWLFVRELF